MSQANYTMSSGVIIKSCESIPTGANTAVIDLAGCDRRSYDGIIRDATSKLHRYAIRTRSRHEKMVAEQLKARGLESFLPLVKRRQQWTDRATEVEPVFAGRELELMRLSFINASLNA